MKIDDGALIDSIAQWAARQMLIQMTPKKPTPICEWIESNVPAAVIDAESESGYVHLYPYQREPLMMAEEPSCREITLMCGQRLGKSQTWKLALLKRTHDTGVRGLIVYPSLELAVKTNRDSVIPLISLLPEAAQDMTHKGNRLKNAYNLPSLQSQIYFMGGGSQVISLSANMAILDETDYVELQNADEEGKNMDQLRAVRLRMKTFKECCLFAVSSPSLYSGVIYQNWKRGSQGRWSMRCQNCGGYSPTSQLAFFKDGQRWAGLQWEKDANGDIINDSIRWVCPMCGHAHVEAQAKKMNEEGCYVHARPDERVHRSFQAGALANPALWSWREIAQAQEDATDADGRKYLCNTVLGMPYKHVRESGTETTTLDVLQAKQLRYPDSIDPAIVIFSADTQKSDLAGNKYWVYVVRAWTDAGNSYLLDYGMAYSPDELRTAIQSPHMGHVPNVAIVDSGGFDNSQDLDLLTSEIPNLFQYKGTSDARTIKSQHYIRSALQPKLFLCSALHYQVMLLELLYNPPRYSWNLPETISAEYMKQLTAVAPNDHMRKNGNGDAFQNWMSKGERRDFFDAEKMALAALDIFCHELPARCFSHGHKPMFFIQNEIKNIRRFAMKKNN